MINLIFFIFSFNFRLDTKRQRTKIYYFNVFLFRIKSHQWSTSIVTDTKSLLNFTANNLIIFTLLILFLPYNMCDFIDYYYLASNFSLYGKVLRFSFFLLLLLPNQEKNAIKCSLFLFIPKLSPNIF